MDHHIPQLGEEIPEIKQGQDWVHGTEDVPSRVCRKTSRRP